MNPETVRVLVDGLEKLCVIVPVLGVFFAWIFKKIWTWAQQTMIAGLERRVMEVLQEVKPNGGNTKSLGDSVLRLEKSTDEQNKDLGVLKNGQKLIHEKVSVIEKNQAQVKHDLGDTDKRLLRLIRHAALNDLQSSALAKECEKMLLEPLKPANSSTPPTPENQDETLE